MYKDKYIIVQVSTVKKWVLKKQSKAVTLPFFFAFW